MTNQWLLQHFCATPELNYRGLIGEPFSLGDHTYATNGHIIVRVPRLFDVPERESRPPIERLPWDHDVIHDWLAMPEYVLPLKTLCPDCEGTQYTNYCPRCYELKPAGGKKCTRCGMRLRGDIQVCDRCDWRGLAYPSQLRRVNIGPAQVDMMYLELIKELPAPWEFALDVMAPLMGPLRFRFNGGVGNLMPMRQERVS